MRDITQRYVVLYNDWPVESFDDEHLATERMTLLRGNQMRSWEDKFPMQSLDNRTLWRVKDMAKVVAERT